MKKDVTKFIRLDFQLITQGRLLLLRGRSEQILGVLGKLVVHLPHHTNRNPEIKQYHYLCTYLSKDSSAWTEVRTDSSCSKASITAPGGRDLGDF